jgi:hypothetical protein
MQLNLYVPADRTDVVEELDRYVTRTGRSKNDVVLEAIQQYLRRASAYPREVTLPTFDLGVGALPGRADLYEGWLNERDEGDAS